MTDKKIAGVCSGIARYLNMDATLARVVFVVLLIYPPGVGLLLYIACWIVMPRDVWGPPQTVAVQNGPVGV